MIWEYFYTTKRLNQHNFCSMIIESNRFHTIVSLGSNWEVIASTTELSPFRIQLNIFYITSLLERIQHDNPPVQLYNYYAS